MAESSRIHEELKRCLRQAGVTYADVGRHLGLSEASVKRLFSQQAFSLRRLESVCELIGIGIVDLVERLESRRQYLTALTLEQERALVADPRLLLMTYMILNGADVDEVCRDYAISHTEAQRLLVSLDRLRIIELRPFNTIRLLTARNFTWRADGPVQRLFTEHVQREFLDSTFAGSDEALRFVAGSLSDASRAQLLRGIDRLAREFDELVRRDAALPRTERTGCSAVLAMRPWELSLFAALRRPRPE